MRGKAARHKLRAMRATAKPQRTAWYVISLRPIGQHGGVRRAAARAGMGCIAISTMRIAPRDDAASKQALRLALAAPRVVFTSPNAVRSAAAMQSLRGPRGRIACAVGGGTAAALKRAGVREVEVPEREDSDGLLALDALRDVRGRQVGLVTAPGGRDRIAPGLRARGAEVIRADVYARATQPPTARAWQALRAARGKLALALSSSDALEAFVAHAPADLRARILGARILAGSERLADVARAAGFRDVRVAAGAAPADLLAVARDGRPRRAIR